MSRILSSSKNFALVGVSQGYDDSAVSVALNLNDGDKLPNPSTDGEFVMVWWNVSDYPNVVDDPNKEIVRVTARSGDTLTITRGQEDTSASVKNIAGKTYKMASVFTAGEQEKIETALQDLESDKVEVSNQRIVDLLRGDGWNTETSTLTYASATTFTIAGDQTDKYHKGGKVKLDNDGSTKRFYVVDSSYSTNTTVTVTGEDDLVSGAITNPYYSYLDVPQGMKPNSWYTARYYRNASYNVTNALEQSFSVDATAQEGYGARTGGGYTTPLKGWYHIESQIYFPGEVERQMALVRVNSATLAYGSKTKGYSSTASCDLYLGKGEEIQLGAYQNSGSSQALSVGNPVRNFISVSFLGV